ncbi:MAG: glucose-6-phosphate dehydrogenase [Acidimicrobiia bacterium]
MSAVSNVPKHLFVVFGATGDLARRKLFPSLYTVVTTKGIVDRCYLLGASTTEMSDGDFRDWARAALIEAGHDAAGAGAWCEEHLFFCQVDRDPSSYDGLRRRIEAIEAAADLPGNRVFYLALPPPAFPAVIDTLGEAGLNSSPGWTRLVIEKPFGTDLTSARELNEIVVRHFTESQVYRIDHYLGKETVQNLLTFRFSNPMFESVWNRDRIASVEITVAEQIGIEGRASYYDSAGVVRDMVQNHLTQVMALVAMEPPITFGADHIRNEKVKVVEAVAPIDPNKVVFGQYSAGTVDGSPVPGYREEKGVPEDSNTPTFIDVELEVDTWRWQGVPFRLRTGKRLARRLTEVAVTFRLPPLCIFHGRHDDCVIEPDTLLMTLQPDEGFTLHFNVKAPGQDLALDTQALRFSYGDAYRTLPDAYQTLILDIMEGDQTLFVRSDEAEDSWRLWEPLLEVGRKPLPYPAGTWGPAAPTRFADLGK